MERDFSFLRNLRKLSRRLDVISGCLYIRDRRYACLAFFGKIDCVIKVTVLSSWGEQIFVSLS